MTETGPPSVAAPVVGSRVLLPAGRRRPSPCPRNFSRTGALRRQGAQRSGLIGAALALGCFAGPAVATTITWSAPGLIDQRLPFAVPEGISDLSCPSIRLCVGTQASGVEISRHPLGGARAWAITALPVTPGVPLGPISCASPRLCVAVNDQGQLFTSTNPTGGAGAWRGSKVSTLSQASAVSCPRVRFCIALEGRNVGGEHETHAPEFMAGD